MERVGDLTAAPPLRARRERALASGGRIDGHGGSSGSRLGAGRERALRLGNVLSQVGQAGRAEQAHSRLGLDLIEALAERQAAADLGERQLGALAPGHGADQPAAAAESSDAIHTAH